MRYRVTTVCCNLDIWVGVWQDLMSICNIQDDWGCETAKHTCQFSIPRHPSHLPADHCFPFIRIIIEKVERKSTRFTKLYRPILHDTLARKILFVKTSMFSKCFFIAGECEIRVPTHPVMLGGIISASNCKPLRDDYRSYGAYNLKMGKPGRSL